MNDDSEQRRGPGRPPTGEGGVPLRDYPQTSIRWPQADLDRLKEVSAANGVSMSNYLLEMFRREG